MARAAVIFVLVEWLAAAAALAAPAAPAAPAARAARQRVVLADPDPELRQAMERALAPWRLEVVIDGPSPADPEMAQQRSDADSARFVVWRDGDQLVVYDRELGSIERRASRAGALDPPTAAAAALTIKTMMRLPPPPPPPTDAAPVAGLATPATPPAPGASLELRLLAGIAGRLAPTDAAARSMRLTGGAAIRPWPDAGWRLGVAGDVGTSAAVSRAGFKGTWREWGALAIASWSHARGRWELEPHAGVGVRGSTLDGVEMAAARRETTVVGTVRGGLAVRWRLAAWTLGASVDLDASFHTPTYSKAGASAEIFQVPALGAALGAEISFAL